MAKSKFGKVAAEQKKNALEFNEFEKFVLNAEKHSDGEMPHVNMKYYTSSFECFSTWSPEDMKSFSNFIDKLRQMKWSDIYKTGGKLGHKTGLGYTLIDRKKLPNNDMLEKVSEDITFFELRVDKAKRVHGFRCLDAFYLVYLDRDHRICP
ncbi:hypothetical protein [Sinorhizobium meliloti]|uniref:hypothetical protein n=1 Tax=Rhizobium meliloti TaxID=382 RepID=UPI003F14CBCC